MIRQMQVAQNVNNALLSFNSDAFTSSLCIMECLLLCGMNVIVDNEQVNCRHSLLSYLNANNSVAVP